MKDMEYGFVYGLKLRYRTPNADIFRRLQPATRTLSRISRVGPSEQVHDAIDIDFVIASGRVYELQRDNALQTVAVIIPAHLNSSRLPGKLIRPIVGATGVAKTLLQRTWESARQVRSANAVIIATDSDLIFNIAKEFGAKAVMTSSRCSNGTERCAEVALNADEKYDFIVNWQADTPLVLPHKVDEIISSLWQGPKMRAVTLCYKSKITAENSEKRVVVEFDQNQRVSRFFRGDQKGVNLGKLFLHVGVYGFTYHALEWYSNTRATSSEKHSKLEQLRFLDHGISVNAVIGEEAEFGPDVNYLSDVVTLERYLAESGRI